MGPANHHTEARPNLTHQFLAASQSRTLARCREKSACGSFAIIRSHLKA